ncbi:carbohydrate ABC transporter permease [Acidithiobacillus sp. M4-SHS-6]|uniref:carbohydrate ABC transporter permease n=1 Tax=Acidithiobacillus sp. M4-SHS-6 TaxID=3383024 RepID=UPI0039BDA3CF
MKKIFIERSTSQDKRPIGEVLEPWFFIGPSLILLLLVGLYPIIYTVYMSFHHWIMGYGVPRFNGFSNYIAAFTSTSFRKSVFTTLELLGCALPIEMIVGLGIALTLDAQYNRTLKHLLQICLVIPIAITPAVIGMLTQLMFNRQLGIINYLTGLVGIPPSDWLGGYHSAFVTICLVQIWEWTPFVALVLSASLAVVPTDIEEAAMLETERWWPRFKSIVLPFMWPGITAALVFQTAYILKEFGMIYSAGKGGPGSATEVAMIHIQRVVFSGFDVGVASAESLLLLVLSIVLARIYIRVFYREA